MLVMQFNQTNNNRGDVNNAITGRGNVVQAVGSENKVQVDRPKESLFSKVWALLKKVWPFWKKSA